MGVWLSLSESLNIWSFAALFVLVFILLKMINVSDKAIIMV